MNTIKIKKNTPLYINISALPMKFKIQDISAGIIFPSLLAFFLGIFSLLVKRTGSLYVHQNFSPSLLKRKLCFCFLILNLVLEAAVDGIFVVVGITAVAASTAVAGFTAFDGLPTVEYGLLLVD